MSILKGIKIDGTEGVHQLDYENAVANKPFGKSTGLQEILPEQDVDMMYADGVYIGLLISPHLFSLEQDKTVVVNIDETEYTTKTALFEGQMAFGNMALMGGEDTGEPFYGMLVVQNGARMVGLVSLETPADAENPGTVTHTVSIKYDTTITKKLGKEFVAIDWNSNDASSVSSIKNRPFGTILAGEFILPETTYTAVQVNATESDGETKYQAIALFDGMLFAPNAKYGLLVDDVLVDEGVVDPYGEDITFGTEGVMMNAANMVGWYVTEEEYTAYTEQNMLPTKTFAITYQPDDGNDLDVPVPAKYLPGICPEKIWTNGSPTAEFAGQTLTFDKNYSMYVVVARRSTSETGTLNCYLLAGLTGGLTTTQKKLSMGSGAWNFTLGEEVSRSITASTSNSITFDSANCYDHTAGTVDMANNAYAIPTEIYGIR